MGTRTADEMYNSESTDSGRDAPESPTTARPVEAKTSEKPVVESKPVAPVVAKADDDDHDHEPETEDLAGLKKALVAERGDKRKHRKARQETEKRIAELEGRLAVYQQQHVAPVARTVEAPKEPDIDDLNLFDPSAVKNFVEHRVKSSSDAQEKRWYARNRSAAMERHEDFDEFVSEFAEAAKTNPSLWDQADNHHDPAEFIYKTGKTVREMKGVNSVDDLRAKIEAEVRAKIASESTTQAPQVQAPQAPVKPVIPKSLASIRGTGLGVTPEWKGARSAEDMYNVKS